MYVTGFIFILVLLFVALLLLRLRVRFELSGDHRLLFAGLGRTGVEIDFKNGHRKIRLFGRSLKTGPLRSARHKDDQEAEKKPDKKKPKAEKPGRVRAYGDILRTVPAVMSALWHYSTGLLGSLIIEKLEAEIEAGFEAVDLTGQVYGYYQAALAAAPSVVGRVRFRPDWTDASFDGSAHVAVALPVYRLVFCTLMLIWRLPLRQILKVAIGKKRGGQDG